MLLQSNAELRPFIPKKTIKDLIFKEQKKCDKILSSENTIKALRARKWLTRLQTKLACNHNK